MKSSIKQIFLVLISLGLIYSLSFIYNGSIISNAGVSFNNRNLNNSAISGRIHIDNNWTAAKAADICTGNGIIADPYVIEDLEIDGAGLGSAIMIENTDERFMISGCTISNSGGGVFDAGIRLVNVDKGLITNNVVHDNSFNGILLYNSDDNIISGNDINSNIIGISIDGESNHNIITQNSLSDNLGGILLDIFGYGNLIFLNCFMNVINAHDDSLNSYWDYGIKGNYWEEYSGLDLDGDGVGDIPYDIEGDSGSQDKFPLMKCPTTPEVGLPAIPGYNLIVLIGVLSAIAIILIKKKMVLVKN
ncbi:MAG: Loki-CTERM sorting domain-containing protein [Promethearchaeota archaeon]|jgi:parallel beta-helix repeat protein